MFTVSPAFVCVLVGGKVLKWQNNDDTEGGNIETAWTVTGILHNYCSMCEKGFIRMNCKYPWAETNANSIKWRKLSRSWNQMKMQETCCEHLDENLHVGWIWETCHVKEEWKQRHLVGTKITTSRMFSKDFSKFCQINLKFFDKLCWKTTSTKFSTWSVFILTLTPSRNVI